MSVDSIIFCGSCENEDKKATKWCTKCEDGVCEDCEKVHHASRKMRAHKLISIQAYRKIEHVSKGLECEDHNKKFDWFCKAHDQALCGTCVLSHRKTCLDVLPIQEAAKDVTISTTLDDLEETIAMAITNLDHYISDRDTAINSIEMEEENIKKLIDDTRSKINAHLDDLEERFLTELSTKFMKCRSEYSRVLKELTIIDNSLNHLKDQTTAMQMKQLKLSQKGPSEHTADHTPHIKHVVSDVPFFLGTHQINKTAVEDIESMKLEVRRMKTYSMEVKLNPFINDFCEKVDNLGIIRVKETTNNLDVREPMIDHAHLHPVSSVRCVHDYQLQEKQRFHIKQAGKSTYISSCIILQNGRLLIADYDGNKQIMEYNEDGCHTRDIPVSGQPFVLTGIDSERIAVTFGKSKYLEVLHIKYNIVEKKVNFGQNCWGVCHQNGKIYVVVEKRGVVVTDLSGKILNTLKLGVDHFSNITVFKDRVYYTDWFTNIIHCCDMKGDEIWTYQDKSIVNPRGLSVDNNHNVFVVGLLSHGLSLIQNDGEVSRTLLTETDGLNAPHSVYYCRETHVLLLCNLGDGHAVIYNVI